MPRFEDVNWVEDIDLSGGPAAIEANLNLFSGYTSPAADQINAVRQKGLRLMRIMAADETPYTAAQFGDIALATRRQGDISLPLSTPDGPGILTLGPTGIPLPPYEQMDVLGNASGVGAEQHCVVARILNPNQDSNFTVRQAPTGDDIEFDVYEMPTDANTADTIDNFVDITGRLNAYTNGQTALPDDQRVEVWLHAVRFVAPAGQSGIALAMPSQDHVYIYCAPSVANVRVDLEREFGGALYCQGDSPINIASVGTATTLIPTVLEMSVKRPTGV